MKEYECSLCHQRFSRAINGSLHNKREHAGKASMMEVDGVKFGETGSSTVPLPTSTTPPATSIPNHLARVKDDSGVLICDCPKFRRDHTCTHIAEFVTQKLDHIELDFGSTSVDVPLFLDPPITADPYLEFDPDNGTLWKAMLRTQDWEGWPYGSVNLGIVSSGVQRLTLRYMLLGWLVAQDDQQNAVMDEERLKCTSMMHAIGEAHRIGDDESKERLANLWHLLRFRKCSQCVQIEEASRV